MCKTFTCQNYFLFKIFVWFSRRIFCNCNCKMQLLNAKLRRRFVWWDFWCFQVFFWCKVNFIYRKHRNCFGNFFQSTTNCVVSPFLKFRKNISNFPFKISKSVLTLYMPNPQNGQTHSSNLSTICQRIVWVCLAILLRIKMTFVQTIPLR